MTFWDELLPPGSCGPLFIGILNVTPDSFSDGGRFFAPDAALTQALRLIEAGAGMLDVGAESTRPGAMQVDPEEEWRRLDPVLKGLREALPQVPLSLDTRHPETARRGLEAGVAVLNDVTGFSDPAMLDLARNSQCGLIAMRSRPDGAGFFMPRYDGSGRPLAEAIQELQDVRDRLTLQTQIDPRRILLDPGFGFGTTFQEDQALWEALPQLPLLLSWPKDRFCLGISRKRFLAWRNGTPDLPAPARDLLTREAHQEAMDQGFRVFRTHAVNPR